MRDEFMITRQGKQYVLFAGLLDEAHERGLRGIDTELIQVPSDENGNVAVVKAVVEMEDGRAFGGIGDASPENVGRAIAPHLIRMAETRAKARALRDAVNVGATALEELSDGDDGGAGPHSSGYSSGSAGSAGAGSRPAQRDDSRARSGNGGGGAARQGQQSSGQGGGQDSSAGSGQRRSRSGPRPVEADEGAPPEGSGGKSSEDAQSEDAGANAEAKGSGKARKSQVDLLKTLAVELRGEGGVERLESTVGKSLSELTREEADEWIDRLTPKEEQEE